MNDPLVRTLAAAALIAVPALAAGLVSGPAWGWAVLSVGLFALLASHARHLRRLARWAAGEVSEVPEGTGVWQDVLSLLYRRERAQVRRRRTLARLLARSRRAGRALPYGMAILDAEHRIVWCNDSSESQFGVDVHADAG